MTSLCLHATSERWKQRQDQAERARPHFPQQRRHVLQPADASTAPPPSRRGVSLLCAAQGSLTVHGCQKPPFNSRSPVTGREVLDSGFIVGPQARVRTLQYGQPAHDKPGESKCRFAERRALHKSSVLYTCENEQRFKCKFQCHTYKKKNSLN